MNKRQRNNLTQWVVELYQRNFLRINNDDVGYLRVNGMIHMSIEHSSYPMSISFPEDTKYQTVQAAISQTLLKTLKSTITPRPPEMELL